MKQRQLSKLAQTFAGSAIREMFNAALKMQDTISFTVGEPDFVTPRVIIDKACEAWQEGRTHYTPNAGIPLLREAIANFHRNDFSVNPQTDVLVTCGATEAIQLALFALVNPGEEVILIEPAWSNYFGQIAMCGADPKIVVAREENHFVPDPSDIEKAITDKTKAIILNSPSNPTGAVIDEETYARIIDVIKRHDLYIIADEVYSKIIFDGQNFTGISAFPEVRDRVIYINSFSKMFAMTGWRLGYAISQPEIISSMTKLHENGASCLPEPSQIAAADALIHHTSAIRSMRVSFENRRNLICEKINEIEHVSVVLPKGAFYAFANIKELKIPSRTFCMQLLENTGVVIVPGSGFGEGGEGYVRITYATSEENILEGMSRLKHFVEQL